MSAHRILASAAIVAALAAVVAMVMAGRSQRHEYKVRFTHAGLLVNGADVLIGGQKQGSVTHIGLTGAGEAEVTIELRGRVPALPAGTTASLEAPSLSGQANRYIAVNPGPQTAPRLDDGSVISSASTTSVVEIDELYNLFDKRTRDGLRNIIRGQRDAFSGRAADADRFYATFGPAVQASDRLFRQLESDGRSLRRFVVATAQLAHSLRTSSADLQGAVEQSAGAAKGFADASQPLERAIARMPATFAEGRRSLAALRLGLPDFERLIARGRPALAGLPAFARAFAGALGQRATMDGLSRLVRGPGAHDDLVDVMRGLPPLAGSAVPAFRSGAAALTSGKPLVDQLRPYMPDITSMLGNTGRALAPYDAIGHYARILPQFGAFTQTPAGMQPIAPSERVLGLENGNVRRCPGGATQRAPDASSPIVVAGCDPSEAPPGS